jgi:molecular chaperone GrpE
MSKHKEETQKAPGSTAAPPGLETAEQPALTQAQIEELKIQAAKAAEHWDRLLRATADFDNFKKRAARERQDAIKFANESLMQKLIPVLDSFESAISALKGAGSENPESLLKGVSMIHQQLKSVLSESGLDEIEAHGKPFDPNLHEAVSQAESEEHPEGHVVQQLRRGYRLRERLLRPATVIVAKPPAKS